MKYKKWSDQIWRNLKQALKEEKAALEGTGHRPVAAFDADGTLWHTDLGENFFRYEIDHCALPGLPPDPWGHYQKNKEIDPKAAYLWLAQINSGQSLTQVKEWAEKALGVYQEVPLFPDQQHWIEILLNENVEVFIVTASVKWAVEPMARRLGLSEDQVIGIETAVVDGQVTDTAAGFMTYREGKAEAILEKTRNRKPFFCAGNTPGDLALLSTASRVALAVRTSPEKQSQELIESEGLLRVEAERRGWLLHEF